MYQCETQASIDGEDTRALCNRNSRVGLSGTWGTLFYGNWDTPYRRERRDHDSERESRPSAEPPSQRPGPVFR